MHPDDGEPVTAAVGAYGPYVRHKRLNASLPEVTMYICVAIVCQSLERPDSWGRPWLTLYGKAPQGGVPHQVAILPRTDSKARTPQLSLLLQDCDLKTITLEQAVATLKAKAAQKASRTPKAEASSSSPGSDSRQAREDTASAIEGAASAAPRKRGRPRKSQGAALQPQDADRAGLPKAGSEKRPQSRGTEHLKGSKTERGKARKSTSASSRADSGTAADQAPAPKKRGRPKKEPGA